MSDNGQRRSFGESPDNYSTRVIAQRGLSFLKEDPHRPFFLMLTPRAPHPPAIPDPIDAGAYDRLEVTFPLSFDEQDVSDKPAWIRAAPRLTRAQTINLTGFHRRQWETLRGLYRAIGSIVETLRSDGRLGQTWIVFTSDNGLMLGEHRWRRGKANPYEESIRVPLIVVPPGGLSQPRVDAHLVANIDLAPTIADILGSTVGGPLDGRSLLPLIADPAQLGAMRSPSRAGRVPPLVPHSRHDHFRPCAPQIASMCATKLARKNCTTRSPTPTSSRASTRTQTWPN